MTQERKSQLEDEILAYEEKMKRLNVELKKLQGFHQESEIEVRRHQGLQLLSCWGFMRSPFVSRII